MKLTTASPARPRYERKRRSEPMGFARAKESGARFSTDKDSGSTKKPYSAFARLAMAATQNGSRGESPPSKPPMAGPSTKPSPKATPTPPYAVARLSGGVTSAMYAYDVEMLAAVIPET